MMQRLETRPINRAESTAHHNKDRGDSRVGTG